MDKKEFWAMVFLIIILATVFAINTLERRMSVTCQAVLRSCPDGTMVGPSVVNGKCEIVCPNPFTTCVNQGNPVMESYPRQCRFPDGTTVIEVIN